jgi:hypothetical protein
VERPRLDFELRIHKNPQRDAYSPNQKKPTTNLERPFTKKYI